MPIEHVPMYPRVTGIPILTRGIRIGTGRIEASGDMVITFVDPVPRDLVTMIQEGFIEGFILTSNILPAEPIRIIMNQKPR